MYDSSFEHSTISLSTLSHFYTYSFSRGILHFPFSLSPLCHICIPLLFLGLFVILGNITASEFCLPPTKFAAVCCYFSSLSFPFFFPSAVFSVFFSPLFLSSSILSSSFLQTYNLLRGEPKNPPAKGQLVYIYSLARFFCHSVGTSSSLHESDNFDQFCSSTGRHILFVHFSFSFFLCGGFAL